MTITRVDPMSLAKVFAVLYAGLLFLFALPMGCLGMMGSAMSDSPYGAAFGGFGLASIITLPLFGAIAGFIGGLIQALLYNVVAGWVGGVQVEVDGDTDRPIL